MRCRIIVSPAQKRNVTIDRCPPIKSIEICTCRNIRACFRGAELQPRMLKLDLDSTLNFLQAVFEGREEFRCSASYSATAAVVGARHCRASLRIKNQWPQSFDVRQSKSVSLAPSR